jgi:hypothetical protein
MGKVDDSFAEAVMVGALTLLVSMSWAATLTLAVPAEVNVAVKTD